MVRSNSPPTVAEQAPQRADPEPGSHGALVSVEHSEWSGQLPPPEVVAQFDAVVENGAERIFVEWETEAQHRRSMETFERMASRGVAFVFSVLALGTAAYCASVGLSWPATAIGGGTVAAVVWAFTAHLKDTRR